MAGGWYHGILRFPPEYPLKVCGLALRMVTLCILFPGPRDVLGSRLHHRSRMSTAARCVDAHAIRTLSHQHQTLLVNVRFSPGVMEPCVVCLYDISGLAVVHGAWIVTA